MLTFQVPQQMAAKSPHCETQIYGQAPPTGS